jgi:hypothetical protein
VVKGQKVVAPSKTAAKAAVQEKMKKNPLAALARKTKAAKKARAKKKKQ